MTRIRTLLAVLTALVLVLAAAPLAGADEGEEPEDDGGIGRGAKAKIELLSAEFATGSRDAETVESDLEALLESGVGFGDAFRIQMFISATDVIDDLDAFLLAAWDEDAGEYDFSWGELKKGLGEDELAALAALPKNLGQLVSSVKRGHGRPDHAASLDDKGERGKSGKGDRGKSGKGDRDGGGDADDHDDD